MSLYITSNTLDLSLVEVQNTLRWSIENFITLNLKKTWEMVVRGNTKKPIPEPMKDIERKGELKLLGVTFTKLPCNCDTHFDHSIHSKASSGLYMLRVCKYYGYYENELISMSQALDK